MAVPRCGTTLLRNSVAGKFIASSQHDGIHLDLDAHQKLGEMVAEEVKRILGESSFFVISWTPLATAGEFDFETITM